jgi:transposase
MIRVDEKENIRRLYFIKRHSIRSIARENHYSRKTVRKAISDASVPEYRLSTAKPRRVMDPYLPIIEKWLTEDDGRPEKQRHTAHRIYVRLVSEHGFQGGERTVREHVSKLRQNCSEMAIPLEFDPGADAQCDWGEALVYLKGKAVTANVFCMKLSYSGRPFVMAFPTQRQEAFFEGQCRAFEWYEGVPARISFDNLSVAVQKILTGHNRIEQQAFIAFRSHYLFESHFATPATPREQGRVESLVGYMRRNYFVPIPEVESFEELNLMLVKRLCEDETRMSSGKQVNIGAAWEEEKKRLLPLPHFPHRCCISLPVKANRLSLVNFDNNRYSIPVEYGMRSKLTLHAYAWKIEIACNDRVIATHERSYDKDKDLLKVEHYLPLLIKRPGAFPYARPVRQWFASGPPEIYREFLESLSCRGEGEGVRAFLQVLSLGQSYGRENLEEAMKQALLEKRVDLERVRQLVSGGSIPIIGAGNSAALLDQVRVIFPDLSQYDRLRVPVLQEAGDGQ